MAGRKYYLTVIRSRNHAVKLHYVLDILDSNKFHLVSTPCEIQAGCSYSIKFYNLNDLSIIENEAKELSIEIFGTFSFERKEGKNIIKRIN
ncbi:MULTISPECIES: DUF3343 domain-containing protein [Tissierellales]|jgi:TFIIF-interacting CTD phosphatase-like protein|uniref:DUF3343 domain-containing protein n=1 Tax=Acidilutibacter cellobiosedens TaxID=2507161 RepID=A0A410QDQ2_9FIRM|nr:MULTISPECIES: DUF3343 domain-containing protein [Tissierellales]MBE6081878.1 DUF3343 domain-containing protein [Tissierellaceae bacterium]QAT62059.1 DUF3343 domain-containing protein [Acidilutibacter cellobiosedens]SCL84916.1 hypothetical protein PP176A_0739 [Sporanaerobacter sp. PP17-6a]